MLENIDVVHTPRTSSKAVSQQVKDLLAKQHKEQKPDTATMSGQSQPRLVTADVREAVQEGELQQPPAIGSLEAIVEEQAVAEGAARQARVYCCYPDPDAPHVPAALCSNHALDSTSQLVAVSTTSSSTSVLCLGIVLSVSLFFFAYLAVFEFQSHKGHMTPSLHARAALALVLLPPSIAVNYSLG